MNQHLNHTEPTRTAIDRITGFAAVLAPVALLASTVAYALEDGGGLNDGELGGAVQIWAFIALGLAIAGLARWMEHSAPRASVALTVLGFVSAGMGASYGVDSLQAAIFDTGSLLEAESAAVIGGLQIPGLLMPVTLVLLGLTMAKTGLVSTPHGWLLVAGAALFPASRIPDVAALAIASDVLVLAALVPVGLRILDRTRAVRRPAPATALAR